MADTGAVVLHKVIKEKSLEGWSKLKLAFFNAAFLPVYSAINKYYNKYSRIPDFAELDLYVRDFAVKQNIHALSTLEVPEIELDVAIDSLINEYTQNEALHLIDGLVDNITLMESQEVKDSISNIGLLLDEKTHTSTTVVNSNDINIFEIEENIVHTRVALGISNAFDAEQGAYRSDYIVFGGKRGQGKSVVLCNIGKNQYEQGNIDLYFTIEMRAHEIFQRKMAMLANVPALHIKQNRLTKEEILRLAKVRSEMFIDGYGHYKDFLEHEDRFKFEANLIKNCKLKEDNQIVIIDDPALTLPSIDIHLQKLKAKFGDKLKVVCIDYLNQISFPGNHDKYDWKPQIEISSKIKEFGQKYDALMVSAFQIDDENKTRFAKGILDSPDFSYVLDPFRPDDGCMGFDNTKVRSGPRKDLCVGINWDTLTLNPVDVERPTKVKITKKSSGEATVETPDNLPF